MKKTKTLFDQAIEIIEGGGDCSSLIIKKQNSKEAMFYFITTRASFYEELVWLNSIDYEEYLDFLYTRLLLARELWNDGQEKYYDQGLFY